MHIQEWRKKRGLTLEKLSDLVGIHINTLVRWENGSREPRASDLTKLAQVLQCSEAELLNGQVKQEFEVKIIMGVKSLTELAGVAIPSNNFMYGVEEDEPQITLAGRVRIGTLEEREKALAKIIEKFKAACWMFDHKKEAEAQSQPV